MRVYTIPLDSDIVTYNRLVVLYTTVGAKALL